MSDWWIPVYADVRLAFGDLPGVRIQTEMPQPWLVRFTAREEELYAIAAGRTMMAYASIEADRTAIDDALAGPYIGERLRVKFGELLASVPPPWLTRPWERR